MINAQRRTVIVLFAIFIGLLGVAALAFPRHAPPSAQSSPTPIPYVFPRVLPAQITRIDLEDRRDPQKPVTITLIKTAGDWQAIKASGRVGAPNLAKIARLLNGLASLRYNRIIDSTSVEAFGLADGGRYVIRFVADRTYTLHIGGNSPDQTLAYVQRDGSSFILLVSAEQITALTGALEGLAAP
ncbi:MAG: hypothetical protein CUN49_08665 [Candidatus Thermofonsia Clade 1 bacterium]|uniref:Uncharacterized protein n=1 Tax=Candidatus Thermofonsia Clade 1 bacterium TaxID=2364210 RepID=A0A2M8PE35_9CHLR|nr:MAG: hypothetical protein CUN49_08665 [Candidatus Thermofonsia Clade 1 bacterium]PJF42377.1 MAG: hypothetical protein CUN50_04285 [Candidatus Thermofonsia Clade 1 bacterium]